MASPGGRGEAQGLRGEREEGQIGRDSLSAASHIADLSPGDVVRLPSLFISPLWTKRINTDRLSLLPAPQSLIHYGVCLHPSLRLSPYLSLCLSLFFFPCPKPPPLPPPPPLPLFPATAPPSPLFHYFSLRLTLCLFPYPKPPPFPLPLPLSLYPFPYFSLRLTFFLFPYPNLPVASLPLHIPLFQRPSLPLPLLILTPASASPSSCPPPAPFPPITLQVARPPSSTVSKSCQTPQATYVSLSANLCHHKKDIIK